LREIQKQNDFYGKNPMKNKSLMSLDAAQTLINNRKYTSSIHHSYYAVFQYMKYMLAHTSNRPIPYDKQVLDGDNASHESILLEIQTRINDYRKATTFVRSVRDLKQKRKSADYETTVFTDDEGFRCKSQAEGLISNLKTYFGNI